ncbi:MAG: bifunctional chorismate mutase/prephenate dehydrogenase [Phycisphaerales bacterium]
MTTPQPNADESALARPLPVLRALIDAVDHELLQLLSRRNGLVGEIAAYKRAHGVAIRDHHREREIIADRRNRSGPLGLRPDVVESLFRLMLWASRDRQAALRAEIPLDLEPRTVAIVGGAGAMGGCLAQMFADLGHAVMIADVQTQLTPREAASVADVVLISVPIDVTVQVINELGPHVREDSLLLDVTSIKTGPMQAMLQHSKASVVGTHPLFGPSVHSLQGQRIVLTPGRGDEWLSWLRSMFTARGLSIKETTPQEHDRAMAVVQVLTHFSTEVIGKTMAQFGVPLEGTLQFTSPVYLMELLMTARHFAQSPQLYASIQTANPLTRQITDAFLEAAAAHKKNIQEKDNAAVEATFDRVRAFLGSFTDEALEKSSFLIDRLVERS